MTKSNAQRNGMVLWDEVSREVGRGFGDVEVDWCLVDAMTVRMVLRPETIDTVVATNLVSFDVDLSDAKEGGEMLRSRD